MTHGQELFWRIFWWSCTAGCAALTVWYLCGTSALFAENRRYKRVMAALDRKKVSR